MNKTMSKVAWSLHIKGFLCKEEEFKINSSCYSKPVQIQCANKNVFMGCVKAKSVVYIARSKIDTNRYEMKFI